MTEPVYLTVPQKSPHAYRIAEGAVKNAIRHSGRHRITIRLNEANGMVLLQITANAPGKPPLMEAAAAMEFESMKSRAKAIGGQLLIEPTASSGTQITCSFPK
jgi:signal transduction histidine kinase